MIERILSRLRGTGLDRRMGPRLKGCQFVGTRELAETVSNFHAAPISAIREAWVRRGIACCMQNRLTLAEDRCYRWGAVLEPQFASDALYHPQTDY